MNFFFFKKKKNFSIFMMGSDESGKAKILNFLRYDLPSENKIIDKSIPIYGFNQVCIEYKDYNFTFLYVDCPNERMSALHIYSRFDAFIFVVDSNDRDGIESVGEFLTEIVDKEETQKKPILIMANKQDLDTCLSPEEISKIMEIEKIKGRECNVIGTSDITGKGIKEGMDWILSVLTNNKDELKNYEIYKLKEELNKAKKTIEILKSKVNELERLKSENKINSSKILDLQKLIKEKDEELNKPKRNELKNEIQNLQRIIKEKDEELIKLKEKFRNIKCVNILSQDENLCFAIPCSGNSFFSEIEELLYKKFPQYRGENNMFLKNGKEIVRNKTINDNKIGTGEQITLIKLS